MECSLSIVVPVYNSAATLKRCVDSILEQNFDDMEVILVNDGSQDESKDICDFYASKDKRVVVIHQENAGPSKARNAGLDRIRGEYVIFVDSDDYIEPDLVEKCMKVIQEHRCDMVIYGFCYESQSSRRDYDYIVKDGLYVGEACRSIAMDHIDNNRQGRIPSYSPIRITRTDIIANPTIRFNERVKRSEDYLFWMQILFRLESLYVLGSEKLYHYVNNDGSITNRYLPNYWAMVKEIYHELMAQLPQEPLVKRKLQNMLVQRSLVALRNSRESSAKEVFEADCAEILNDKELLSAIRHVGLVNGTYRSRIYCALMLLGAKPLIKAIFAK